MRRRPQQPTPLSSDESDSTDLDSCFDAKDEAKYTGSDTDVEEDDGISLVDEG